VIRKSFAVLPGTTKVVDDERGVVEAWVNSTGIVDAQKDNMEPGCWADITKAAADGKVSHPSTVWGHDWSLTTGKVIAAQEYPPGDPEIPEQLRELGAGSIRIRAHYNLDTQRGRDAYSDVKFGAIGQWSVGFVADPDSIRYDSKGVRHIGRVAEWPEVSNVLMGASPGTMTASVKAGPPEERKARTADRLERACAILDGFKAAPAAEAKAGGGVAGDPPGVPWLEGDESQHNGPLMQVLDGINTLIGQEVGEGGYTEYRDIIQLCCLAQDAIRWAAGEQTDYGDFPALSLWDLMTAGRAALSSKAEASTEAPPETTPETAPPEEPAGIAVPAIPAWLKAAMLANSEIDPASPQHPVPALSGDGGGLEPWEQRFVDGFSAYSLGLHAWLANAELGEPVSSDLLPPGAQGPAEVPREWTQRFVSPRLQQRSPAG
jgi:hypothetical protein